MKSGRMNWFAVYGRWVCCVVLFVLAGGVMPLAASEPGGTEPAVTQETAALAAGDTSEETIEKPWSVSLETTFSSKYVWRGINLVDDVVFQPSVAFTYEGFTVSAWINEELTDYNESIGVDEADITEVDYTVDYSFSAEPLNFSLGVINYHFPNTPFPSTTELYAGVGADVFLAPSVTVYGDIDEAEGVYTSFVIGHSFEKVLKPADDVSVSVDLGASLGVGSSEHNEYYYGSDTCAVTDVLFTVGVPVAIGDCLTVTPSVNYSMLVDDDIREAMTNDDNFWAGISAAVSF